MLRSVKIIAKPSFVGRELFVKSVPMKAMCMGERLQALSRVSVGVENLGHAADFMFCTVNTDKLPGLMKILSLGRMYPLSKLHHDIIMTMFMPDKII